MFVPHPAPLKDKKHPFPQKERFFRTPKILSFACAHEKNSCSVQFSEFSCHCSSLPSGKKNICWTKLYLIFLSLLLSPFWEIVGDKKREEKLGLFLVLFKFADLSWNKLGLLWCFLCCNLKEISTNLSLLSSCKTSWIFLLYYYIFISAIRSVVVDNTVFLGTGAKMVLDYASPTSILKLGQYFEK